MNAELLIGLLLLAALIGVIVWIIINKKNAAEREPLPPHTGKIVIHNEGAGSAHPVGPDKNKEIKKELTAVSLKKVIRPLYHYDNPGGIWTCPNCETENMDAKDVCSVCGWRWKKH